MVGGESGFVETGYLLVVNKEDRSSLQRNVSMACNLGINTKEINADDLRGIAPTISISEDEVLAWEPQSGYVDAHMVTTSYGIRAREMGSEISLKNSATGIEIENGRVKAVTTEHGRVETPVAVVASGPWSKSVLASCDVDVPLVPVRHQVASLSRPVENLALLPMVSDVALSFSFRPDGLERTMIGFGPAEEVDMETYNQGVDLEVMADALHFLARRIPMMAEASSYPPWSE